MNNDEKWMALAIKQAVKADTEGEVPVGGVIVKDGQLIAQAHNQPISTNGLISTITSLLILTFANPHVYLDTVVLIGAVSQQFPDKTKLAYALGAALASFVFFFTLAYGAKFLSPVMQRPIAWRLLDSFIAFVMFGLAIKMTYIAGWF